MARQERRRANRSPAEWSELVGAWRASGLSGREFAEARDIGLASLYGWAARLESEDGIGSPGFTEVAVAETDRSSARCEAQGAHIELVARSGRVIRVVGSVDAEALRVVLQVAERC